jgi:hypothetical protein
VGGNVEGANVDLIVPANVTGGTKDAVIGNIAVDATGVFEFQSVPAPGSYTLRVRKVGSITTQLSFELSGGETRSGITVQLRTGDGSLSGLVNGQNGPLGAATITVTSPDQTASTLSLTTGVVGSFSLPDLLTPSSYAVSISSSGYATKNITVSLASGQKITDLNIQLSPSTGSISGLVRDNLGSALGGIPITITDGVNSFATTSVTIDDPTTPTANEIGSFTVLGLPVPGIYTVTFGGGTYSPVVRNVALQSTNLNSSLLIDLVASAGRVSGTVSDQIGFAGGVQVQISNGVISRSTTTASVCVASSSGCVGTYRFENVPAGVYTITFTRTGSVTYATQVAITPGSTKTVSPTLSVRSSIQVYVCKAGTGVTTTSCANQTGTVIPQVGYQVRVWKESDYPSGPILGVGLTNASGSYTFNSLDAPVRYVVEVTNVPGSPALTSQTVTLGASSTQIIGLLTP